MKQLWTGRLDGAPDGKAAAFNASLSFDRRLAAQDVRCSIAWSGALARAGVISAGEAQEMKRGLEEAAREFAEGRFPFAETDEDIHTAVERRLGELIGETAGKLHTGRSRNDQVATDFRMWIMGETDRVAADLRGVQKALLVRAERDLGVVMPGYTHTQRAQPVLLAHWWLSHFWALERDHARMVDVKRHAAVCPLGSGALAGTSFAIDREALAKDLGFESASPNSIDAVSDRDFAAEFLFCAALIGVHVSRLADALILFGSSEFGFIEISDSFATGSSLMPQKKNPDALELARGKSGRLIGLLTGLLATLKGLPSAYDKDLQEDKPPVFEAADTIESVLPVLGGLIESLAVSGGRMAAAVDDGMLSVDLAEYLVGKGVPFRTAHSAAGRAVRRALELGVPLSRMEWKEFHEIHSSFGRDLAEVFTVEGALARRDSEGGTAPEAVKRQIHLAREIISRASSEPSDWEFR
jgi:argininosuccinate lyase